MSRVIKTKLSKSFKKRWTTALRSKEFTQGQKYLYNKDMQGHCCLGVACALGGLEKSQLKGALITDTECKRAKMNDSPNDVLSGLDALCKDNDLQERLADYNDRGKSFNWIAAYIDRYL